MKNKIFFGHLISIMTILIWGTTFISSKVLLVDFSPVELLFFRSLLAITALTLFHPRRLKGIPFKHELMLAAAGLCGVTLYFLLENMALTYTQASNASVIVSTAPIFTAFFAFFFLKQEKLSLRFFLGFLAAISGIFAISFSGVTELNLNPKGDLMALGAALVWGIYSTLIRKIGAYGYHTVLVTRRVFIYGTIFMIPFMYFMNFRLDLSRFLNPVYTLNILYLGIGASAICFVAWNYAIKLLGALKTSVYIYLIPVVTIITSVLILDETITLISIVGTALTVLGLLISESKKI